MLKKRAVIRTVFSTTAYANPNVFMQDGIIIAVVIRPPEAGKPEADLKTTNLRQRLAGPLR